MQHAIGKIGAVLGILCALPWAVAHASPQVQATLTLGNKVQDIAIDPALARAYVSNLDDATVSVIDVNGLQIAATITTGLNPRQVIADAARHLVYVIIDDTPPVLAVIDGATNTVVTTVPISKNPRGLGSNLLLGEVYVSGNKMVTVIDAKTNTVAATIAVGAAPGTPSSNDVLQKMYVPNTNDNTVSVIDERKRTVIATIPVGMGPAAATIDGRHGKVYVNNPVDQTVSVIDSATDTVIATLPSGVGGTGANANSVVVSAVYHRAYLPNAGDNTLTIIDTDNDTVVGTVAVGQVPVDLILDQNGGNVYVANQGDNTITILDAGTDTIIETVPGGKKPFRVMTALSHLLVLSKNGTNPDVVMIASEENTRADTSVATDFYEAGFDHYFHTADEVEARLLVDGLFTDNWHRTFDAWRVWTSAGPGRAPVCRFFSTAFGEKSSHFYTPYAAECQQLQAPSSAWQLESATAYYVMLTDASGGCPSGTVPLYRVYNDGMGGAPNHRYTADLAIRAQMVGLGWIAEGNGPDIIFACIPPLS